jgi:hypothetical protein
MVLKNESDEQQIFFTFVDFLRYELMKARCSSPEDLARKREGGGQKILRISNLMHPEQPGSNLWLIYQKTKCDPRSCDL